jgi:hypothetical protein
LFHLLYLLALIFDLLLLLLQLALRLLILYLPVLQLIANYVSATSAKRATDGRSRRRVTHSGADYCAGTGAQQGAHTRAFFALRKWLS